MSELIYYLKPNEVKDGSLIEIPVGKVAIGRGPFLRCTEKRVSRNHAELTLTLDGDLSIIPKHVNPTYHRPRDNTSTSVYKPLEKEKLFILKPGDSISLLPDSLTYEIVVKHKIERMDALLDENTADDFKLKSDNEAEEINKNGQAKDFTSEVDSVPHRNENSTEKNKTRELPAWIIEMAENTPLEEKKLTSNKKKLQVKKVPAHENKATEISETLKISNESLDKDEQDENVCVVSKVNPEVAKAGTSATLKESRPLCEFGEKCYRKNPNHKLHYSHPGDDDYKQTLNDVSDDDDDRPECEYGTDCYRKNPDHKKAYKHSTKPKRKAVIKAKRRKENETENDDEDDEYDESFIDDSDEYDPKKDNANYSSDDDDDLEVLNKEAKSFIKNKKL